MFVNVSRGAAALVLAAGLAGCSTSGSGDAGPGSSITGTSSASGRPQTIAPAQGVVAAAPAGAVVQSVCPQISLRDGTAFYRTYAKKGSTSAQDVVFQATLAETTRACTQTESTLTIKAQVQGRLISGPQGRAGTLSLPIRVVVVDGDKVLSSELVPFSVSLASPDQPAQFLFSRDVTIAANPSATTQVFVGFDEGPVKGAKTPARKTPRG